MDNVTLVSIAVAVLVMAGVGYFTMTKIGRSGGTKIMGKGSDEDSSGRQ